MKIKPIQWSEELPANEECMYNHCIGKTPLGRFLITWKGWKEHDCPTIDETPWSDWRVSSNADFIANDLESAKKLAESIYQEIILKCVDRDDGMEQSLKSVYEASINCRNKLISTKKLCRIIEENCKNW